MSIETQIQQYISSQPEAKRNDLLALHKSILSIKPKAKLWFLDGKNEAGKVVSNPNIGYGLLQLKYADGTSKDFYQVGLSANTSGISVYIMGMADKKYLADTYAQAIGKATITGYCIKFKALKDINMDTLQHAIKDGFAA